MVGLSGGGGNFVVGVDAEGGTGGCVGRGSQGSVGSVGVGLTCVEHSGLRSCFYLRQFNVIVNARVGGVGVRGVGGDEEQQHNAAKPEHV